MFELGKETNLTKDEQKRNYNGTDFDARDERVLDDSGRHLSAILIDEGHIPAQALVQLDGFPVQLALALAGRFVIHLAHVHQHTCFELRSEPEVISRVGRRIQYTVRPTCNYTSPRCLTTGIFYCCSKISFQSRFFLDCVHFF